MAKRWIIRNLSICRLKTGRAWHYKSDDTRGWHQNLWNVDTKHFLTKLIIGKLFSFNTDTCSANRKISSSEQVGFRNHCNTLWAVNASAKTTRWPRGHVTQSEQIVGTRGWTRMHSSAYIRILWFPPLAQLHCFNKVLIAKAWDNIL